MWAAYFKQVVERSRLEAHARRVALRAQPRESFLEMASQIWKEEVLPDWPAMRTGKQTLMLWWEGLPSEIRGDVWTLAINSAASAASAGPDRSQPFEIVEALVEPTDVSTALAAVRTALTPAASGASGASGGSNASASAPPASPPGSGRDSSDSEGGASSVAAPVDLPPELNMFSHPESPLHTSLTHILACVIASARLGGPPPPPSAPLLVCMLLLYMDEPLAYASISSLASHHCVGVRPDEQSEWRLQAAESMIKRELPDLHGHLMGLGIPTSSWLPEW